MNAFSNAPCRRVSFAVLLCVSGLTFFSARISAEPLSEDVPVPGGTSALSRALGLDPPPEPARFITQLTRVIYDPDGTNQTADAPLRKLTDYFRSTRTTTGARVEPQIETVPVPLSARIWSDAVFQRPIAVAALFPAIIGNRRAALLCYGLAALDDETLQFLSDHAAV